MWCLVGLILIAMIPDEKFQQHKLGLAKDLCIWLIVMTVLMAIYLQFGGSIRKKPSRMDWPQQQLAIKTEQIWKNLSHCELDNIGGNNWLAILSATGMKKMPSVMMDTDAAYSPWMNENRLLQHGSLMLWEKEKRPLLPYFNALEQNPRLVKQTGEFSLTWKKVPTKAPLHVEWVAFVPKTCLQE